MLNQLGTPGTPRPLLAYLGCFFQSPLHLLAPPAGWLPGTPRVRQGCSGLPVSGEGRVLRTWAASPRSTAGSPHSVLCSCSPAPAQCPPWGPKWLLLIPTPIAPGGCWTTGSLSTRKASTHTHTQTGGISFPVFRKQQSVTWQVQVILTLTWALTTAFYFESLLGSRHSIFHP